jgi:hypothetical protein
MGKKNRDRQPTVRVQMNSVTGKLESTTLDATQLAFERVVQTIDGQMLKLSAAEGENLARRLLDRIARMLPHTGGERGT